MVGFHRCRSRVGKVGFDFGQGAFSADWDVAGLKVSFGWLLHHSTNSGLVSSGILNRIPLIVMQGILFLR
jgi:hypothetical protein